MSVSDVEERAAQIAGTVIESMGMELVDAEYRREHAGWVLRLYIDKDGGVTLDNCSEVSREVGAVIDIEDLIDHRYSLEVSSPGLTRPLKKMADFEKFNGRVVRIKCYDSVDGRKSLVAINEGVDGGDVVLNLDGKKIKIAFSNIAKANIEFTQEG